MAFAPGSAEIRGDSLQYADKLAALLVERDNLQLNLCGRAGGDDQQWLNRKNYAKAPHSDSLLTLADDRAKHLKRLLIEKGVPAQRLYLCKPSIDSNKSAAVLLSM
jgi:outer membrane protein OmpA-like peptidoglycan-associated protein